MKNIHRALLYAGAGLLLTTVSARDGRAQTAGDNSRAATIVTTYVDGRAASGQRLSTDQARASDEFLKTDEAGNSNRRATRISSFPTRTRSEVVEEARLDRRQTRRRQNRKLSEIAGAEVVRPTMSETMPFEEGSACELASLDYVFYPDDQVFTVTPPWTADISQADHMQLNYQACNCGWQVAPRSLCINLTEYQIKGSTHVRRYPDFSIAFTAFK